MIQRKLLYVGFALLISPVAQAAAPAGTGVSYEGQILKPDGTPLQGQNAQFKLQIRTPDPGSCLLYEEQQTLDLRNSGGNFSLTLNDGSGTRLDSTGLPIERVFANQGTFTLNPTTCLSGPGTYSPAAIDGRKLVVLFKDETMTAFEPIPAETIASAPFAIEAKQVAGFGADSLLRVVTGGGAPMGGLAPLSNSEYTALLALATGSSTAYSKANELKGVAVPTMNSGEVLGWNGSTWVSQSAVGGASSVTTAMLASNSVDSSKILTGAVGTSQLAGNLSINTSGTVGSSFSTTRDFKLYATSPSTFYVGMMAPALSASYTLTWPMNAGTSNQVLTTNGAGGLSWTTPGGGTAINSLVGDVTATGPGSATATVVQVGAVTAANVASGANLANTATAANTVNMLVRRDGTGNFSATDVTTSSLKADTLKLNNAGSLVNVVNPIGAAYTLTLPTGTGTSGQVLTTNGTGVTSWATPTTASNVFTVGGNNFGANVSLGTNDGFDLNLRTSGSPRLTVNGASGNVGIGTTAPQDKLQVNGSLRVDGQLSTKSQSISAGTVDWDLGNTAATSDTCSSAIPFANLRDGGTYTLVATDSGTTQCNFATSTTGKDAAAVVYRFKPLNGPRTASSHTIYTLMRVGNNVYVSWGSGF